MRVLVLVSMLALGAAPVAAQPTGSAAPAAPAAPIGSGSGAAPVADAPPVAPAPPPDPAVIASPPAVAPACRLAAPPPKPDPNVASPPTRHSAMRQVCEDELAEDHDWWFNLEARLRSQIHRQAAAEITTNNRHVVLAYGAMWLLAVAFVVAMWRRQQALRAEIARLAAELKRVEGA